MIIVLIAILVILDIYNNIFHLIFYPDLWPFYCMILIVHGVSFTIVLSYIIGLEQQAYEKRENKGRSILFAKLDMMV